MTAIQTSCEQAAQLWSTFKADTAVLLFCVHTSWSYICVRAVQALLKQAVHKQPISYPAFSSQNLNLLYECTGSMDATRCGACCASTSQGRNAHAAVLTRFLILVCLHAGIRAASGCNVFYVHSQLCSHVSQIWSVCMQESWVQPAATLLCASTTNQAMQLRICSQVWSVCMQESWVQPAAVHSVQAQPKQEMHWQCCSQVSSICAVCMQESWVQPAAMRAVQAQPKQAIHLQTCSHVSSI